VFMIAWVACRLLDHLGVGTRLDLHGGPGVLEIAPTEIGLSVPLAGVFTTCGRSMIRRRRRSTSRSRGPTDSDTLRSLPSDSPNVARTRHALTLPLLPTARCAVPRGASVWIFRGTLGATAGYAVGRRPNSRSPVRSAKWSGQLHTRHQRSPFGLNQRPVQDGSARQCVAWSWSE
jgi:hypothetical protein